MSKDFMSLVEKYKKKQLEEIGVVNTSTTTSSGGGSKTTSSGGTKDFMALVDTYRPDIAPTFIAPALTVTFDAPIKKEEDKKKWYNRWFQKGAFEDGYQFGDVVKTILGTTQDTIENVNEAVVDATENLIDTTAYGVGAVGGLFDKGFKDDVGDFIAKEILAPQKVGEWTAKWLSPIGWLNTLANEGKTEDNSILNDQADGLVQSGAHMVGSKLLERVGVPAWLTQGVNAFGSEIEYAFQNDATFAEAGISGGIAALSEVMFEKISSGIKFKGVAADETFQRWLKTGIKNKLVRGILKFGADVTGEGLEEALTEITTAFGKKATYFSEKEWNEILSIEDLWDAFFGGALMGGVANGVNNVKSLLEGTDPTSGLTAEEEKVVNKAYEEKLAEAKKSGTVSPSKKTKIYNQVVDDLKNGKLSTEAVDSPVVEETDTATIADTEVDSKNDLVDTAVPGVNETDNVAQSIISNSTDTQTPMPDVGTENTLGDTVQQVTPTLENQSAPVVEESSDSVSPELQSLYDKRQALNDTLLARYNDGLYNEETDNLAEQWDIVNRQIADIESAQKAVTPKQESNLVETEHNQLAVGDMAQEFIPTDTVVRINETGETGVVYGYNRKTGQYTVRLNNGTIKTLKFGADKITPVRSLSDIVSSQNNAETPVQETAQSEQSEPTTADKVRQRLRDEFLDDDTIKDADTPEIVAKFESVSKATEVAQDFISKGTEGVKAIPDIFGKISETGELDNFESYLRHRLNFDRSTLEQRYGSEVPNRPVFSNYTAEQSQKIADDLERKHPEFKQAAEDVYAFNNYLLDLRVKAGRVTQEWADHWREMYPHYVPLSRSRHGEGQAYSALLHLIQGTPVDTSDLGAVDSFLNEVDSAAEVHKITSSGSDFNPLIDTMVNQAFTVYWDLAANQPGSITAPVADSGIKSAPVVNDTTTESEQTQPEVDSVTIETESPAESNLTEYDPHHLMDSKKGVGKVIQAVTDAVEVYVLDDAIPFEKVAKKTGTSLDASFHATRNAFSSAQYFIGKGNEAKGVRALTDIVNDVKKTKETSEFLSYLGHLRNIDGMSLHSRFGVVPNKNFMGRQEDLGSSYKKVKEIESSHPEFKKLADDVYAYTDYLRNQFVERGMISQQDADMWKELYPHFVPMRYAGNGSVSSMLETLAHFTTESFNTLAMNEFGVDLKNALKTEVSREPIKFSSFLEKLESGESMFDFGKNGKHHTFTVYENGERVTYDITDEMYLALNDAHKWMDWKIPVLYQVNEGFRKFCTEWNIFFSLKNGVKDPQDIIYNSKHPLETYAHLVDAGKAIWGKKGNHTKYSQYYQEYLANGGEPITYYDSSKGRFTSKAKYTSEKGVRKNIQYLNVLEDVSAINDRIEKGPRFAEYIASREAGRTVKEAMLDSAQVTTNFAAGGKLTKFLNRNGCTFLNASVQGALQHARNFANAATGADGKLRFDTKEAKVAAVKGVASLIARGVAVGMATIAINDLRWKDDEEYEQLPDYVKEGYYLIAKYGDGQFVRIPKGRTNAVVEEGIRQVANASIGNDEADWNKFWQIFFENIAPNNPLTNNIFAPIREVGKGETWYGEDLIPTRLQKEDTVDQYDEKTDRISVALSKWLNDLDTDELFEDPDAVKELLADTGFGDGLSPKEINYLINSYTGVLGDLVLPYFTPKAETSSDNPLVQALAPLKDIFTTDSVLNNKLTGEFYDTLEEVEAKAKTKDSTPEDKLKSGILIGYNVEISDLMKEQREIQNSDMPDSEKYQRTRELKKEINALQEEALGLLEDYKIDGNYAESGDKRYNYDAKDGTWWEVKPELANGKPNPYYVQEQLSHDKLGLSYADFWNGKRPSPDFEGKTYYAEYNGKRYNYDADDNSWYEIKPKKKNGEDNYYYQSEQIAHNELGVSYEDFWNNREAYMDAVYVAKNGVEYGWGNPYYETVKTAIGMDSFAEIASGMANIKGESRYDDMNKYIYSLDIPEVQKHILFKAEYPKTNKYNHEIIDYLNEREDISYSEMKSILEELGFKVDGKKVSW